MNFEFSTREMYALTGAGSFPTFSNKRRMSFMKDCSEDAKKVAYIIIHNGKMKKGCTEDHLRVANKFLGMDKK